MRERLFDAKEYILDNGIQLVTIKKETKLASIHIGLKVGSLYEDMDEKGISHFIEHMLFKGTEKRDNAQVNQDLEERAGSYNAYTDYTSTVYSITSLSDELESSIEVLYDIIINSTFPEEEVEKEKGVILAEIRSSVDDIEQYSINKAHEYAFKKSPLRHDILGEVSTVKSFTRGQLVEFYHSYYVPNRCVISVVSPYAHEDVKTLIEKYFIEWTKKEIIEKDVVVEKNIGIEKVTYKKHIEQNTLVYLYTFHGLTRLEELTLDILNHRLGESSNSILFRELREKKGLAYDVYSQMDTTESIKTLYIYTAVGKEHVYNAKEIIQECIDKIKNREIRIDEKDVELMRKIIKTAIASILENSQGLGNYVLHQKLMGKRIDAFIDDLELLDKIQTEDVYKIAKKVLDNPTIHILLNKN
ncbi:M16 family metallopeptidase [Caldisalinibacter kiritimatiensis]|uniref:Putative zinc protease n=1 Tax=Caldisalinibacter kiritimatiensis TaxID=1304284 RepID=R1CEL3_9FIRM|nr:pitrilysin family protein [Caldisalinibacter kiritimatiensis]EOD00740.1 Putative zinc protease [Caldisalinibacter kiritimatiensis]